MADHVVLDTRLALQVQNPRPQRLQSVAVRNVAQQAYDLPDPKLLIAADYNASMPSERACLSRNSPVICEENPSLFSGIGQMIGICLGSAAEFRDSRRLDASPSKTGGYRAGDMFVEHESNVGHAGKTRTCSGSSFRSCSRSASASASSASISFWWS